jgi:hypothetical protein
MQSVYRSFCLLNGRIGGDLGGIGGADSEPQSYQENNSLECREPYGDPSKRNRICVRRLPFLFGGIGVYLIQILLGIYYLDRDRRPGLRITFLVSAGVCIAAGLILFGLNMDESTWSWPIWQIRDRNRGCSDQKHRRYRNGDRDWPVR